MTKENSLFPFGQILILELINDKGFIQDKSIIRPLFHASLSVFIYIYYVTVFHKNVQELNDLVWVRMLTTEIKNLCLL